MGRKLRFLSILLFLGLTACIPTKATPEIRPTDMSMSDRTITEAVTVRAEDDMIIPVTPTTLTKPTASPSPSPTATFPQIVYPLLEFRQGTGTSLTEPELGWPTELYDLEGNLTGTGKVSPYEVWGQTLWDYVIIPKNFKVHAVAFLPRDIPPNVYISGIIYFDPGEDQYASLGCRIQSDGISGYYLNIYPGGYISITRNDRGEIIDLWPKTASTYPIIREPERGSTGVITLICDGDTINSAEYPVKGKKQGDLTVWAQDVFYNVTDSTYAHGSISFSSFQASNPVGRPQVVRFNNFTISKFVPPPVTPTPRP